MNLSDDIIEKILIYRRLYIALKIEFDYNSTYTEVLGIYGLQKDAQNAVIYEALKDINYEYYDPAKRYEFYDKWRDRWINYSGMHEYRVETWKQNDRHGLENTEYFNFDYHVKNRITDNDILSTDSKMLLQILRTNNDNCYEFFSDSFLSYSQITDRISWQKIYGHVDVSDTSD